MTTQTTSLATYLLAQIAADEAHHRTFVERATPPYDQPHRHVLATCAAHRNLVKYAAFMLKAWDDKPGGAYPDMTRRERHTANVILDQLAAIYADHPIIRPGVSGVVSGSAERFRAMVIVADSHAALAQEEWELMAEAQRRGQSVEYVDPSLCRIYRAIDPAEVKP
jgi:hypothetical protein